MNIAIFTDTYLPDINGVAMSSHILRNELIKHGHQVLIVTTEVPQGSSYEDEGLVLRLGGLDIKRIYGYRMASIYSFHGMKEIKEFQPDIIHIQTEFGIGIFGKIVSERLNIPLCYTYHTMWADYTHYLSKGIKAVDLIMKKIIEKISKIYGETCSALIVPSQKTADVLISYGIKNQMFVIGTGLNLEKFDASHRDETMIQQIREAYHLQDKFVIVFVGRIAPEKSVDFLICSLSKILESNPQTILMIVGDGPALNDYKNLTQSLSLEDYVIFTGAKDINEVPQYYHVGDVFASASITETQGLTYIEAMATGLPVFARYDRNLEDVIDEGKNGYFFSNEEEFIKKIISLDEQTIKQLSQQASIDSQQFSSEMFYEKILNVYQHVLKD